MKDIAFQEGTTAKESLPLPIVLYPGFYGAFFGFKQDEHSDEIYFCSCSKEAIENYIKIRLSDKIPINIHKTRMYLLDSLEFPISFVEKMIKLNVPENASIINELKFKDKICHECNGATPSYRYCHEMYGQTFKQNYGWYIKKRGYELGLGLDKVDFDLCPKEILELLEIDPNKYFKIVSQLNIDNNFTELQKIQSLYHKQQRKIWNIAEDDVRLRFGHKKIGEAWTSETILYYIITKLFPDFVILRHYRPDFLEGLEFDIFIKEKNIGIEYQGIQHFKEVKHWGGKPALEKLKQRDKKKRDICKKLKIPLIYFNYDEDLEERFVLNRIIGS
ncbi:MAG: hypothetical protein WA057_01490 [Candidatus Magasanikiibacteriota bacterium]